MNTEKTLEYLNKVNDAAAKVRQLTFNEAANLTEAKTLEEADALMIATEPFFSKMEREHGMATMTRIYLARSVANITTEIVHRGVKL